MLFLSLLLQYTMCSTAAEVFPQGKNAKRCDKKPIMLSSVAELSNTKTNREHPVWCGVTCGCIRNSCVSVVILAHQMWQRKQNAPQCPSCWVCLTFRKGLLECVCHAQQWAGCWELKNEQCVFLPSAAVKYLLIIYFK